jgi:hypothetical protein
VAALVPPPFGVRGCSFGCTSIRRTPQTDTLLPARGLGSAPGIEEGGPRLSASLQPGDPLPRPTTSQMFWWGQAQSVGESERAAGWKWRTTTRRAGRQRSVEVGGGRRDVGRRSGVFGGGLRGRLGRRRDGITWGMAAGGLEPVLEPQERVGRASRLSLRSADGSLGASGRCGRGCFLVRW